MSPIQAQLALHLDANRRGAEVHRRLVVFYYTPALKTSRSITGGLSFILGRQTMTEWWLE